MKIFSWYLVKGTKNKFVKDQVNPLENASKSCFCFKKSKELDGTQCLIFYFLKTKPKLKGSGLGQLTAWRENKQLCENRVKTGFPRLKDTPDKYRYSDTPEISHYTMQCTESKIYWRSKTFQIYDGFPNGHEGESKEESKTSSKFSHKRLPGVDQLLTFNLNIWWCYK